MRHNVLCSIPVKIIIIRKVNTKGAILQVLCEIKGKPYMVKVH